MKDDQWISKDERMPTAEDADGEGLVLAWHRYQGAMLTGWFRVVEIRMFTHWQHAPDPPPGYEELRDVHLLI